MASSICRKRRSPVIACSSKRRRLAAATLEMDASSWASLSGDLLRLIGWRLLAGDLLDYVRFRAVCPHWRFSTLCPRGRGVIDPRFHPRRWMMLPEGHGIYPGHNKLGGYIRFFNLSTRAFVRAKLPLFKDHCILDSVDGLLLLQRDQDTAIRLLHPFTGDIAEFPPLTTLWKGIVPTDHRDMRNIWLKFRNVSATSFSVSADGVITVIIALFSVSLLAFATPRDQKWSVASWNLSRIQKPISFQGKLYMLDIPTFAGDCTETQIFRIDPPEYDCMGSGSSSLPPPKLIATCPSGKMLLPFQLAECNSEILLIGFGHPIYSQIVVYRLADLILGRVVPVTSIGDNVIFVGERTLSVSSRALPNVEGNSIVTVHHGREVYFGQYHLGSATWSPAADGSIKNLHGDGGIPGPCNLIYHIFTCCDRATWNKGAISFQLKGQSGPVWKVKRKWRQGA